MWKHIFCLNLTQTNLLGIPYKLLLKTIHTNYYSKCIKSIQFYNNVYHGDLGIAKVKSFVIK